MSEPNGNPDAFAEMSLLIRSFQFTKMLQVAASLDLADRIDEPRSADSLAKECGVDAAMLLRLCRALAAFRIFAVDADGNVGQTPRSALLRRDAQPTLHYAVRYWAMPSVWAAWGNLELALQTGDAPFEATFGTPKFTYLKTHPEEGAIFDSFMEHSPDDRHAAVVEAYDFSNAQLVVDVGGGNGALLAAILGAHPKIRGLLFDQEAVVSGATAVLANEADRCTILPGNFFESIPADGDVYMLAQILHTWNDKRCLDILTNCRAAMNPGARLLVIERVLDEVPGHTNPTNFLADMHMMVLFPGAKERALSEFGRLFQATGFGKPNLIQTRSPFCIVETRAAA